MKIVDECYKKAVAKLMDNASEHGFYAASPISKEGKKKNYTSLFSRDIGVCTYGVSGIKNEKLHVAAKNSLTTLATVQSPLGQLPFYYRPEESLIQWWMPGSIDSSLWWAIAVMEYCDKTKDKVFLAKQQSAVERAYTWLLYQDTNNDHLLEQGEASDWADEMPRHGAVLYTNTLWYWLNNLMFKATKKKSFKSKAENIKLAFNTLFWVHKYKDNNVAYMPDNAYTKNNVFAPGILESVNSQVVFLPYYLGFVSHKTFEARCDVYGNILACLVGLADEEQAEKITQFIIESGSNKPYPIKVLYPPIYPGEKDWRDYMMKGRQNYPWQYHNGGIWPYVGGFWVEWLTKYNKKLAESELENLAQANALGGYGFNEYLHGQHGTAMGITLQSWNMAMYIKAYDAVKSL